MSYDLAIIGGGPAGLSAAIYAARYKLDTALIVKEPGGIAATAHKVCNFPSYPTIKGPELMAKFQEHASALGINPTYEIVENVTKDGGEFVIKTSKEEKRAKKVILSIGTQRRKLDIKGEKEYLGKGVSYCATCDGAFFKDKTVAVIGGSDAALTAALLLSEFAKKVYIVYRREKFFRAEPSWIEQVENNDKIEVLFNRQTKEIKGNDTKVTHLELGNNENIETDGVFIEIGSIPNTDIIKDLNVETDNGYIKTDKAQKTNVSGLFAAGDVTDNEFKQIVTAAGEGATAAYSAYNELAKEK